jgi:hypothetical protein
MLGVNRLAGTLAWAEAPPPRLIGMYLLLVAILVVGAAAIVWAARRYRRPREAKLTPEEQLERFRALKEQGELSPEEFERIRATLDRGTPAEAVSAAPKERPGPPDAFRAGEPRP